jgi:hypothetical protein
MLRSYTDAVYTRSDASTLGEQSLQGRCPDAAAHVPRRCCSGALSLPCKCPDACATDLGHFCAGAMTLLLTCPKLLHR